MIIYDYCFRTGARQVFTTQKPFPREIPLTMKTARFLIKLPSVICQIYFEIFDVKQIYTREKSKYLNSIRVFAFSISFFCWNEITKKSSIKEDTRKMENCKANHILDRSSHRRCYLKENKLPFHTILASCDKINTRVAMGMTPNYSARY